jgi:hypothetical protein
MGPAAAAVTQAVEAIPNKHINLSDTNCLPIMV